MYWKMDNNEGVIRCSNHWTGQRGVNYIVECLWSINQNITHDEELLCGACRFTDFVKIKKKGRKSRLERGIEYQTREQVEQLKAEKNYIKGKNVDFDNFWRSTVADFVECARPSREPDYVSKSGSLYWDDGDGVIRLSNHWTGQLGVTKIVNCYWKIQSSAPQRRNFKSKPENLIGKCNYKDFAIRKSKEGKKLTWRKISG